MMPPEGSNKVKVEELLQRHAKERRQQGADFSLHPATRQLLQGEVARQFKNARRGERLTWLGWLRLQRGRFVFGGALAAVVLGCWMFWNRPDERLELAQATMPSSEMAPVAQPESLELFGLSDVVGGRLDGAVEAKKDLAEKPAALGDAGKVVESRAVLARDASTVTPRPTATPVDGFGAVAVSFADVATSAVNYTLSFQPAQEIYSNAVALGVMVTNTAGLSALQQSLAYSFDKQTSAAGVAGNPTPLSVAPSDAGVVAGRGVALNQPAAGPAAAQDGLTPSRSLSDLDSLAKQPTTQLALRDRAEALPSLKAATATSAPGVPAAPAAVVAGIEIATVPQEQAWYRTESATAPPARFYRSATAYSESLSEQEKLQAQTAPEDETKAVRVLERFAVEQHTNTIRLMDSDGSVYEGPVDAPTVAESLGRLAESDALAVERQKAAPEKSEAARRSLGYSFRASGSNVTLRQRVEVSGRFTPAANVAATAATPATRALEPAAARTGRMDARSNRQDSAIEGTIRIGTNSGQRFRAVRSPR